MDFKLCDFGKFRSRPASAPVFSGPAQVRAYWEALRQEGSIPDRAQLDPRGMAGALDRVFLAEPIGRGLVQVRIAGSALAAAAGLNLRGLPISCLFAPEARSDLAKALEPVCHGLAHVELALGAFGKGPGEVARMILLPMADGPGRRMLLGCLGHADGTLTPEVKFTILEQQVEPLPKPQPAARVQVTSPEARRPHLTLVHARD